MTTHREQILTIIANHTDGKLSDLLDDNRKLDDIPGFDSLTRVEVTMAIEEDFNIEIADRDVESWCTIGDIVKDVQIN